MKEQTQKTGKPWSKRKRFVSSLSITVGILVVAMVGGSLLYMAGMRAGLIKTQDLKKAVMEQISHDGELRKAMVESSKYSVCENRQYNFRVKYGQSVNMYTDSGEDACRRFVVVNAGGMEQVIQVIPWNEDRSTSMEILLSSMSVANTDVFGGSLTEGVLVRGERDNRPYLGVLFSNEEGLSLWLESFDADPLVEKHLLELADTFEWI